MYDPDSGTYELDNDKPLVLLIGSINHEGILSQLQSSQRQYKQKLLESNPSNWSLIIQYFDAFKISSVLLKLSPRVISLLAQPDYAEVGRALLEKIGETQNIVFVHESLLTVDRFMADSYYDHNWSPDPEELKYVHELLGGYSLDLIPYKQNAQITVMAQSFLLDTEQNLIFRMYIPDGRIWSNETDRLLQLFRDYLAKVAHLSIRLDQQRTDKGIIYEFHGDEIQDENGLSSEFAEFTHFMDLCAANDLSAAEELLANKNVNHREAAAIIMRYAKESRRLQRDLKQQREQKVLTVRHRMESELSDVLDQVPAHMIDTIVDSVIPKEPGVVVPLKIAHASAAQIQVPASTKVAVTINQHRPQFVNTVNGILAQEINGDQHLDSHAKQLLELIEQFGSNDKAKLQSAVYELSDEKVPHAGRLKAKQRLTKFVVAVGSKATDIATGILQSYIEKQLGL